MVVTTEIIVIGADSKRDIFKWNLAKQTQHEANDFNLNKHNDGISKCQTMSSHTC